MGITWAEARELTVKTRLSVLHAEVPECGVCARTCRLTVRAGGSRCSLCLALTSSSAVLLTRLSHVPRGIELEFSLALRAAKKVPVPSILNCDVCLVSVDSLSTHRIVVQHYFLPMSVITQRRH